MAQYTTIVIKHGSTDTSLEDMVRTASNPKVAVRALINVLKALLVGAKNGRVTIKVDSVTAGDRASQTVAVDVSDMVADTDTTVIAGVTLTWVAASENENQITIPATDIEGAAALVTAIANHSILKQIVYGVSDGVDTVTVYSVLPGPIGEAITLAEAGNGITLGGAVLEGITSTALATYKDYGMGAV